MLDTLNTASTANTSQNPHSTLEDLNGDLEYLESFVYDTFEDEEEEEEGQNDFAIESEFCKNYSCCGLQLNDLHDLLEHYEHNHVTVKDSPTLIQSVLEQQRPSAADEDEDCDEEEESENELDCFPGAFLPYYKSNNVPHSPAEEKIAAFDQTILNQNQTDALIEDDLLQTYYQSMQEELMRERKRVRLTHEQPVIALEQEWFDSFSDCSEEDEDDDDEDDEENFGKRKKRQFQMKQQPVFYDENGLRIEKPYKCPHPGCEKAYKNPNGLKYHTLHGHCEGDDEDLDFGMYYNFIKAARLMKPYVCNFNACFKRYKNLNGLKYHIEKSHALSKSDANHLATTIVKKTNAAYGIHARSVPSHVLFAAMKEKDQDRQELLQPFQNLPLNYLTPQPGSGEFAPRPMLTPEQQQAIIKQMNGLKALNLNQQAAVLQQFLSQFPQTQPVSQNSKEYMPQMNPSYPFKFPTTTATPTFSANNGNSAQPTTKPQIPPVRK